MNQKKWVNGKITFTITMVFVVCCFMSTNLWAARKVDFYSANAGSFIEKLNQNESSRSEMIGPLLGLSQDEAFTLLRQRTDFNRITHYRYQQTYKGIPVWGIQTIISRDSSTQVVRFHGTMAMDIPKDIKNIPSTLDPLGALNKMEDQHKKIDKSAQWTFRNEKYGTYIYLDKKEKVHLCYVVSFFADTECGNPSRPVFFIDIKNGKVIDSFDSLAYAYDGTGPGGNQKIGQYTYGTDYPKFGVAINGSTCTMNYADCRTVDLNHGTSGTTPFSYTCYNNTHESINGGYCPMNDAQFFGQQIYNMYQAWYGVPVLPFQLMMRCHYSNNYEHAFWDGSTMTFGDGYTTFYPLVALDVTAHEVAHGFTENNSGLIYSGQSGGINESYSDMAGEAAEYYVRGTNDFRFAFDIYKNPTQALRYLYNPPLDGISIDYVDDYYEGMELHYSSGIFNKAFYLIATTPGWNTHMAFDVFTKANQDYWMPCTNFQQGAEGALDAAEDYGYSSQDVVNAFSQVGITLTYPGSPGYCTSSGDSQFYEYIARVEVADLYNASGPEDDGYGDYTHLVANITQGEMPPVSLTPGFTSGAYPECWNIWIDYNGDHDFDDAGEHVFNGSGNDEVTGNFIDAVPSCTVCCTRMRVSMSYSGSGCPASCGIFPYGEVEDYAVEISGTHTPVANFVGSPTIGCVPLEVNFTDKSTNNPTDWDWDFGDNGTSDDQDPHYTYTTPGTYTVILTVTNACGSDTKTKENYITVLPTPVADFTASSTNISVYDSVDFTDQSIGNPTSWDWTFEGGAVNCKTPATSTDQNPTGIEYYTAGKYDVSLTVTNALCGGDNKTKVDYITVVDPYCESWGDPILLYTTRVVVDVLDNPSGASPYSDFSQLCADLTQGKTYPVSLQNSGVWPWVFANIWIDYNRDFDFEDAGEEVFSGYGGSYIWGSISVPCGTIIGATRMRVSIQSDFVPPFCGSTGLGEVEDYTVCISPKTTTECTVGYIDVFQAYTSANRGAQSFTMPEDGTINRISMYHDAGSGNMILAVYEGVESPQYKIADTDPTTVNDNGDWQTIDLKTPVFVKSGTRIWLAWIYENSTEIRREEGIPPAHRSEDTWSGGMPDLFGCSDTENYIYSIYAEYTPGGSGEPSYKRVGSIEVHPFDDTVPNLQAQRFIMPETGTIISVSMYHEEGSGNMGLGVYSDIGGKPGTRLGKTLSTSVCRTKGWQTIPLESPTDEINGGTTIWLSWYYDTTPVLKRKSQGTGFQSTDPWTGDMPDPFGNGTQTSKKYSIYANYRTEEPPVANFIASTTSVSVGGSVTFTDQSTNTPTSWNWEFEGGMPDQSDVQGPITVTYNTVGTFDVSLVATNAQGSDSETKTDYITVTTAYCASQGNSQAGEWISRVRVADLDNNSGASPYSNFTSKIANLTRGTSASVTLNTGYSGTVYREYWRVWIDYNHDGDFVDTYEQVFSKNGMTSVTGSFTTRSTALTGATRMRVSMKYGSYPTSCETFTYGEVEDYTANIQ